MSADTSDAAQANKAAEQASRPEEVNTQAKGNYWRRITRPFPIWVQFLPMPFFRPIDPDVTDPLIDEKQLQNLVETLIAKAASDEEKAALQSAHQRVVADMEFLKHDLLRLMRIRDHDAKKNQNGYRLYQILFLVLAAVAAALGALQAIWLASGDPRGMAVLAFGETLVALVAVFLATISGREPPLPRWLDGRRKSEQLRREYFRYVLGLAPYDLPELARDPVARRMHLSERSANINRGVFPDESAI